MADEAAPNDSAPMTTDAAIPVTFMLGQKAVLRLEAFAAQAEISPEEAIRFAVAQFLSYQDGLAMLIVSGHTRAAERAGVVTP